MKELIYERLNNITIGSDCELSFTSSPIEYPEHKTFWHASDFLSTNLTCQLGCDGCSAIAELRPRYSENPIEHLNNLKKIMKRLVTKMKLDKRRIIEGYAGNGFRNPTGGHIHFGIDIIGFKNTNKDILKILDMMSIYLMPMEYKLMAKKRRLKTGYGRLSAYETKSYGFEYRTPASWLYSESNARSILCLSYTLAYEFMNNRELCLKIMKTFNNHFGAKYEKINDEFRKCNKEFFIQPTFNFFKYFEKNVRKMIKYPEYKPYIENLFSLFRLKKKFREKLGISETWKNISVTKNLFYFSNDDFMYLLNHKDNNKRIKDKQNNIYIFGLKSKRDVDLSSNNENLVSLINNFIKSENLNLKVEKLEIYPYNNLGLGYNLRKDNKEVIVKLLKYIKNNLNNKELDNKTSFDKEDDFENMKTETDTEEENECRNCGSSCDDEFCSECCEEEFYNNHPNY